MPDPSRAHPEDREPQPTDGPEYHVDYAAWEWRQSHPADRKLHLPVVKPLLVQFYRCGRASRSRAWTKCRTPELCTEKGCQELESR